MAQFLLDVAANVLARRHCGAHYPPLSRLENEFARVGTAILTRA